MDRNNSDVDLLAKQATDLLREGRAAKRKNRNDTSFVRNNKDVVAMPARRGSEVQPLAEHKSSKNDHNDEPVGNKMGLENFGEATMPSPIRPHEENADWDWISGW